MNRKQAIITGGAGGLGRTTAAYLVERGWHVFAADYDQPALDRLQAHPDITPLFIDVSSSDSVRQCREKIEQTTDRLDAVINFAGVLYVGSVIEIEEQYLQRILDVNLMGTYRVNREFCALVMKAPGRFINISSETGWQTAAPFNGPYALSKYAVEAYSDALRREMAFFDIPVIKVQPGPFRTEMTEGIEDAFKRATEHSTLFRNMLQRLTHLAVEEGEKAKDPEILARFVYRALTEKPRPAYSAKPAANRTFLEFLPVRLADWLLKKVLGRFAREK